MLKRADKSSFHVLIQTACHENNVGTKSSYVCHIGNNLDVSHMILPVLHEMDMIESNSLSCDENNKSSDGLL